MVSKISCILTSCMASHRSAGVFIFSIFTHLDLFQKAWVFPLFPKDGLPSLGSGVLRPGHIVGLHLRHFVCGLGRGGVEKPKTPAMPPLSPSFSHEKQAPSLKWKVLGLFCGAHATWKTGIGMLGKEALLDFGLKCLILENEWELDWREDITNDRQIRYSFPTFSGNKKGPAPTLGHHLHGLSHLLLSFHQLTGDTRVHGVSGRGEDGSAIHLPLSVSHCLRFGKCWKKTRLLRPWQTFGNKNPAVFTQQVGSWCSLRIFGVIRWDVLLGKKVFGKQKSEKQKMFGHSFDSEVLSTCDGNLKEQHFPKLKVEEPQSPHLEAPCAGCGVWDLEIGRTC